MVLLILALLLPYLPPTISALSTHPSPLNEDFYKKQNTYFEWVEVNGGYKHPNVDFTSGPDPVWTVRGLFATAPIEKNERIFSIPPDLVICRPQFCDLVATVSQELVLGNSSFWWPYLSIMEHNKLDLPYVWTDEERDLLSGLHPSDLLMTAAHEMCDMIDMDESVNIVALQIVGTRSAGNQDFVCLIPLFESLNHAQLGYENTFMEGFMEAGFSIYTTDDISANQQLFYSYGDDSFARLFRDYGFFSQYPRLWRFEDGSGNQITFRMYETNEGIEFDFNPDNAPYQKNMVFMHHVVTKHLSSVLASKPVGFSQKSPTVHSTRFSAALAFRQEYINAFQMASESLTQYLKESKRDQEIHQPCPNNGCKKEKAYFQWVEGNGGYKNPKVEISTGPDPSWTHRGIFATAALNEDETIFWIPPDLSLCGSNFCDLVAKLSHELYLGPSSFWWPFLSLMEDFNVDLHYTWNDKERDLLNGLYPADLLATTHHGMCSVLDMSNSTNIHALQLVGTRSVGNKDYICVVPLFEFFNHAPRDFTNSAISGSPVEGFSIQTSTGITENNQMFFYYGHDSFPRLFRDYGFFPQYPRFWTFEDDTGTQIIFKVFERDGSFSCDLNPYNVSFQRSAVYMKQVVTTHLSFILANEPLGFSQNISNIDPKRYATALSFRQEYINAFQIASNCVEHHLLHIGDLV